MFNDVMVSRDRDDETLRSEMKVTTRNKGYKREQGLQRKTRVMIENKGYDGEQRL